MQSDGDRVASDEEILRSLIESVPPPGAEAAIDLTPLVAALGERLELSHERLSLALEVAAMGVWEWEVKTGVVTWSDRHTLQSTSKGRLESTLTAFRDLVHPDDRDRLYQRLEHAAEGGDDLSSLAFRIQRSDASGWRHMLGSGRVMRRQAERATRVVAVLVDVSERRALEDNLQHAQQVECLGQVAGGVAHDFRNLLSVMLAGSQMLLDEMAPDHPWRDLVEDIRAASERGEALTQQLLTFSRNAAYQPASVDVCALLASLEPVLKRISHGGVELRLRLDPSAGQVWADPTQIGQVVMNLVVNARDAMPDGGTVTLSARAADVADALDAQGTRFALIEVQDTGTGIDPALRDRIFEPFFTTKEAGKGTGLGLAMVVTAARQWGGQVQVESTVGQGTTFRVLLPRLSK